LLENKCKACAKNYEVADGKCKVSVVVPVGGAGEGEGGGLGGGISGL